MNNSTFVGNLAADPKLIVSKSGSERATFSVALDEYNRDEDTSPTYVDVTVFSGKKDSFARNVAETLTKGKRVTVLGRVTTYRVDVEIDGEDKQVTKTSWVATSVAPDLRWQTAKVTKVTADTELEETEEKEEEEEAPKPQPRKTTSTKSTNRKKAEPAEESDEDDF